ncbi:MAG: esterase family protein [Bacteroidales bacterium]|nr:esterase family protein [Bacteroidales bacterium]
MRKFWIFICLGWMAAILPLSAQSGKVLANEVMHSEILNRDIAYSVYLPADYETSDRQYRILYLLHGYGGDEKNWLYYGEMDRAAEELSSTGEIVPLIIVSPNADNGWYINRADGTDDYETMFIEEFIPHIEKTFRVFGTKITRAIGGLSMGGYGSLLYSIKHPDLFSVCIALSAGVMTDEELLDRFNGKGGNHYGMMELYGCTKKHLSKHWYDNSILKLVENMPKEQCNAVNFYIDCGDDDFLYKGNSTLHILMRDKGIKHEYRVRNGAHSWTYWRSGLRDGLKFMYQVQRY